MATNRLNTLLQMDGDTSIVSLPINKLDFLEDSPFKIYKGEKKEQLVQSIKYNGIIIPIIVTPIENSRGRYKILSGANRVDAAIILNIEEIKAVVKTDLTEDEYNLIVVETNLFNRSIDDMLPSELAKSLFIRQRAMRQQGKKNDSVPADSAESQSMYESLNEEYKLSERNIRNYIRLTYLCDDLLEYIDSNVISVTAGFELSYLRKEEQDMLFELIKENNYKISIDIAKELKLLSNAGVLEKSQIKSALMPVKKDGKPKSSNFIKIPIKSIISYIKEDDLDKAQDILIEALKLYYEMNS